MGEIFQKYCQMQGVDLKNVRFLSEGTRVDGDSTPGQLHRPCFYFNLAPLGWDSSAEG